MVWAISYKTWSASINFRYRRVFDIASFDYALPDRGQTRWSSPKFVPNDQFHKIKRRQDSNCRVSMQIGTSAVEKDDAPLGRQHLALEPI